MPPVFQSPRAKTIGDILNGSLPSTFSLFKSYVMKWCDIGNWNCFLCLQVINRARNYGEDHFSFLWVRPSAFPQVQEKLLWWSLSARGTRTTWEKKKVIIFWDRQSLENGNPPIQFSFLSIKENIQPFCPPLTRLQVSKPPSPCHTEWRLVNMLA